MLTPRIESNVRHTLKRGFSSFFLLSFFSLTQQRAVLYNFYGENSTHLCSGTWEALTQWISSLFLSAEGDVLTWETINVRYAYIHTYMYVCRLCMQVSYTLYQWINDSYFCFNFVCMFDLFILSRPIYLFNFFPNSVIFAVCPWLREVDCFCCFKIAVAYNV